MKRYSKEIKEEVLSKIWSGSKVVEVAREYGTSDMTIRTWLERDTESGSAQILEMSRLKRENESLLRLVGQLTYESDIQKINQRRERS